MRVEGADLLGRAYEGVRKLGLPGPREEEGEGPDSWVLGWGLLGSWTPAGWGLDLWISEELGGY